MSRKTSFNKKDRFDKNLIKIPSSNFSDTWIRPSDWLTMPTMTSADEKVALLAAVYDNDSNFVAVLCSGNYTVDWGDGTIDNVAAGVKAEHVYTYSTLSSIVCTEGYKMAIITITPQSGQSLTSVDLKQLHSSVAVSMASNPVTPILELIFSCPNHGSTLPIFGSTSSVSLCYLSMLRNVVILNVGAVNSFLNLFYNCQIVEINDPSPQRLSHFF